MKKLENFSTEVIANQKLNMVIVGAQKDKNAKVNFFGYGTSAADCDHGNGGDWTYWFAD